MASSYPGGLDNLANPSPSNPLNAPSHAGQHADANDAIEAIQATLGTNPQGAHATVKAAIAAAAASGGGGGSVAWNDITGKPSNFPPSGHKSTHATGGADPLTPADIGAATSGHTHAPPDLSGYVPTSRTVNGKPLSSNVTLTAGDVGASTFSGAYGDLSGKPTLGTAAAAATGDFATAAQGAKADTALQVGTPVPIVSLSGAQTTGATHAGKDLHITASSGVDLTVQTAPAGSVIQVRQSGAGAITCVGDGVTLTPMPGMTLISAGTGARFAIVYTSSSAADVLGWMVAA